MKSKNKDRKLNEQKEIIVKETHNPLELKQAIKKRKKNAVREDDCIANVDQGGNENNTAFLMKKVALFLCLKIYSLIYSLSK